MSGSLAIHLEQGIQSECPGKEHGRANRLGLRPGAAMKPGATWPWYAMVSPSHAMMGLEFGLILTPKYPNHPQTTQMLESL